MSDKKKPKYNFGNIVVVDENQIGVVVKSWFSKSKETYNHDIYLRSYNGIKNYEEFEISHFEYEKELLS